MASAIMHLCIAKKVNQTLKLNEKEFYLGAIAPDISKQIGASRNISHFTESSNDFPNLNLFLRKYRSDLSSPFTLGYFLHLYSDYIWEDLYVNYVYKNACLKTKDGSKIMISEQEFSRLLYSDYTTLNEALIDTYLLDLSVFYEEVDIPKSEIDEIPLNKLQVLVDKLSVILLETGKPKSYIFDVKDVVTYIDETANSFLEWYFNKKST